ncbi:hypothetical protein JCM19235_6087 [Vibrio maritimus]|uniref:Uncharacterized protein n=1 Tax=Vibrio maritimus TaxID=990268 RepID=A0A090RTM2_9VIBR|nr:hypothetical protein JCM19235_6087 [Vibrio maritimus]
MTERAHWRVMLMPWLSYIGENAILSSRVKSQTKYAIN